MLSAIWLLFVPCTRLKDGAAGTEPAPPPPWISPPEDAVLLSLVISLIALAAPATELAMPNDALAIFSPTNGCPAVAGDKATALAFATAVFETILDMPSTCSLTTFAIAKPLASVVPFLARPEIRL